MDWSAPGPGDLIVVAPGTYEVQTGWPDDANEQTTGVAVLTAGGTPDAPLVIQGQEGAVIDGRKMSVGQRAVRINPQIWAQRTFHFQGFEFVGGGLQMHGGKEVVIQDNKIHDNTYGISAAYVNNLTIQNNWVWNTTGAYTYASITVTSVTMSLSKTMYWF